jgi:hypothetical protein
MPSNVGNAYNDVNDNNGDGDNNAGADNIGIR